MTKWTEERKRAASEAMKAKVAARQKAIEPIEKVEVITSALNALETQNDTHPIPKPTPELCLGLEDRSKLNDQDKHDTIVRLLKVFPIQYKDSEEKIKRNIWNIGRFEPTNAQIQAAQEAIDNEPKRNSY